MTDARVDVSRVTILFEVPRFSASCVISDTRASEKSEASPSRCTRRWHIAEVVADRAGFVDNEPSFINGSPVTKPGRLRPCLVLFLMLPMLLPH